jgi:hypothetical protein
MVIGMGKAPTLMVVTGRAGLFTPTLISLAAPPAPVAPPPTSLLTAEFFELEIRPLPIEK